MGGRRDRWDSCTMSRAARITLVATGVLLLAGLVSGLLIDRHDGLGGAVEWALRTAVVVATVVVLAGGLVLVLRVRRVVRSRVAGWALAAVAGLAFAFFILQ